ncbi:amidase [Kitasatospora kazusensis]|uniref:Amidase n=1 Tax=Kitasatospora kazusensis TaxID=407974 RepID=A0ABN2ZXS8_9ACTN
MPRTGELRGLDGLAQAELVAKGELTGRELVEAAVERIETWDGDLNAVVIPHFGQALAELADGPEPAGGPLHGVPFLLKDLGPSAAGIEATLGSAFMAGYTPAAGSELVERFRRAGLRVLGKTNSAEFGVLPTTEPRFHGPTRNPWDRTRSAGGSSGGSAAAVAAGLVPIAHANDAGGSIRIPAAACGVFGLKPTRARTPLGPSVGDLMNGLASEHVVTRSVRDSAAVLDAVAGPAVGDPYWAPPAPDSYLAATLRDPARPLRIAVSTAPAAGPVDPECVAAVERTARLCTELGHQVVWTEPSVGFADLADPFLVVWAAGVSSAITAAGALSGRTPVPELFEELTWSLYEQGRAVSAADYLLAVIRLQQAARTLGRFQEDYDALLTPTTAGPAPLLGSFAQGGTDQQMARAVEFVHETPLANLTGQPAMSVPLQWTAAGLPVGVHFTGRFGDEAGLLCLAAQLERAQPWAQRLPELRAETSCSR